MVIERVRYGSSREWFPLWERKQLFQGYLHFSREFEKKNTVWELLSCLQICCSKAWPWNHADMESYRGQMKCGKNDDEKCAKDKVLN